MLIHGRPNNPRTQDLVPEDDEEPTEGFTEVDGIIFEGDFEDDSVKPSLTSLLEDVGDDVGGDAFKLDSDDSFFSIPDYVPSELPDLAALGSGAFVTNEMCDMHGMGRSSRRRMEGCINVDPTLWSHRDHSVFFVPTRVPPGLESKRELMSEFVEGEFDPNDQKMYKLLGLDALDEKKTRVNTDDFKLPGVRGRVCLVSIAVSCKRARARFGR